MMYVSSLVFGVMALLMLVPAGTSAAEFSRSSSTYQPAVEAPQPVLTPVSFTQSSDTATIIENNSVSCNASGSHTDNSYLRRFDLDGAHGLTNLLNVSEVSIGIESAVSGTGVDQPIEIRLHSIPNGALMEWANLTQVGLESIVLANTAFSVQTFAVNGTVNPLTSDLVVEVFTPNGQTDGHSFFIGSNNLGQSAPSYIATADCGVLEPTPTGDIGFPDMHIVMVVHGLIDTGDHPAQYVKIDATIGPPLPVDCTLPEHKGRLIVSQDLGVLFICTDVGWIAK